MSRFCRHRLVLAAASLAFGPALLAGLPPPIHAIEVSSPRDYGIVIGAPLTGEVRVAVEAGYELEAATLPQPGSAINDFLELREAAWTRQSAGGETVFHIRLVYQVFKGVRDAETLAVPALPLRFSRGGQAAEAEAPAWNFTVAPLIPPTLADEAVSLRGALPLPARDIAGHWHRLLGCLAGLAGVGVYAAWTAGLLRRRAAPFAKAAKGLQALGRQPGLEAWRQGVRLVHAALNETAGRPLFGGQLAGFVAEQPQFANLQAELEQFFALSDRLFFASQPPDDYPWAKLEGLCRQLAKAAR